ncbi:MAG TPA: DNA polymerase III subunit gamma/tau [Actinomycetota bacterium]|nr:DNA polymerase III subunit gamma/tau [Actinomycetota bacterium]
MADEYQSLYRKYRPQTPDEVRGQEHVVRALVGAVREGRMAHAYLFCGPRGTGKTSTARILAKMVNCEQGPTAEPCGECEQCLRIAAGSHLDVVEIDAASHGGVDDARELRERAPTAPAFGREKVYILDEAQRLSREAFDALLKLFEEPPAGVRFVLCTTEPHKMPATIVGRCQRFDFRRIGGDVLSAHLIAVAAAEGVTLSRPAAEAIARQSEGSARDALSLLDQATVLGGAEIGEDVLEELLGSPRQEVQYAIADAVAVGDTSGVFGRIDALVQEGQDVRHVTSELLQHFRNLLLANTAPGQADLVDVTSDEYERLRAQAAKFTASELSRVIALLLGAQTDMRWTTSPRLTLELALVRATMAETDPAPEALIARMERLERLAGVHESGTGQSPAAGPPVRVPETAKPAADLPEHPRESKHAAPEAEPASLEAAPAEAAFIETAADALEAEPEPEPSHAAPVPAARMPAASAAPAAEGAPAPEGAPAADVAKPTTPTGTAAVDVEMLRRSWQDVLDRLTGMMKAILGTATPVAVDESQLELAFPASMGMRVIKVQERESELRAVLQELFGISPRIRCVVRDAGGGPGPAVEVVEEAAPLPEEAVLARLKAEFDATEAPEPEGW